MQPHEMSSKACGSGRVWRYHQHCNKTITILVVRIVADEDNERCGKMENTALALTVCLLVRPLWIPLVCLSLFLYLLRFSAWNRLARPSLLETECICAVCVCVSVRMFRHSAMLHVVIAVLVDFHKSKIICTHSTELAAHIYTIHSSFFFFQINFQ